eukprot:1252769-Alexandrium_andersonii.AAC.1
MDAEGSSRTAGPVSPRASLRTAVGIGRAPANHGRAMPTRLTREASACPTLGPAVWPSPTKALACGAAI